MQLSPDLLSSLSSHPILIPTPQNPSAVRFSTDPTLDDEDDEASGSQRYARIVVRRSDLILVVGEEVRMMSLTAEEKDVGGSSSSGRSYKILSCPALDYPIHQLSLNPTGDLLALVGTHQVSVISLPKGSYHKGFEQVVECRGKKLGEFYHTPHSSRIVKVDWHPLGENGGSLIVLTQNALLREYHIHHDTSTPLQTVSLLPSSSSSHTSSPKPTKRKGAFGILQDASERAVSFAFGKGEADWGPVTVYGLMEGGEVWAVCPFMPMYSSISQSYLEALNEFLNEKSKRLKSLSASSSIDLRTRSITAERLSSQQKWVRSLRIQIEKQKLANPLDMDIDASTQLFPVTAPEDVGGRGAMKQGPLRITPEAEGLDLSAETGEEVEGVASEIIVLGEEGGVGVVGIVWKDGRVDLGLEVEKVEGMWEFPSNKTGLHPVLALYETIDLGILNTLQPSSPSTSRTKTNPYAPLIPASTVLTLDPYSPHVLYLHHAIGVHRISIENWSRELQEVCGRQESRNGLTEFWGAGKGSKGSWVVDTTQESTSGKAPTAVIGTAIVTYSHLPYSLLILTEDMQLVTISLDENPPADEAPLLDQSILNASVSGELQHSSLLARNPFPIGPSHYSDRLKQTGDEVQQLLRKEGVDEHKAMLHVDEKALRVLAGIVDIHSGCVMDIKRSSSAVEGRLDLQLEELKRHLSKLKDGKQSLEEMTSDDLSGWAGIKSRIERLMGTQTDLSNRLDKTAQRMMESAHPELSTYEKSWEAELGRLKDMVVGEKGSRGQSMKGKMVTASEQLETLKPALEALQAANKGQDSPSNVSASPDRFGKSQVKKIETTLYNESISLGKVVKQLNDLSLEVNDVSGRVIVG